MKALALALLLATTLRAAEPTGEALLTAAIKNPGGYDQMCASPPPVPADVPLPLYGLLARRNFHLSDFVAKQLQEHRPEVVAALVHRLEAMDLTQPSPTPKPAQEGASGVMDSGLDTSRLSGVLIEIVLKLKAVEALPALMKIEAQLDTILDAAAKDPAAFVPDLTVDGINYPKGLETTELVRKKWVRKANAKEIEHEQAFIRCRVFQRELLSAMAKLLREAGFEPFLTSPIEQAYGDAIKKAAEKIPYKKATDIPEEERSYTFWDERYHVPVIGRTHGTLPFTPELRLQIRDLVSQYFAAKAPK